MARKILGKQAFDAQDPAKLRPHGDRLFVEKIDVEDAKYVEQADGTPFLNPEGKPVKINIQRATLPKNPRDPNPDYTPEQLVEIARGWILVRVLAVGNGHRLEHDCTVPMPFHIGQYLYVERLTGREMDFHGIKYHIISQVDVMLFADHINDRMLEGAQHLAVVK